MKRMKRVGLSVLFAAIMALVLFVPVLWLPGPAAADFTVTVPAIEAPVTTTYEIYPTFDATFIASGFPVTADVEILLNNARIARGNTDANGVFTGTGTVPTVVSGTITATARVVAQTSINAVITASVRPTVTVATTTGSPGAPLAIRVLGWSSSELITVTFEDAAASDGDEDLGTTSTGPLGTGAVNSVVPDVEEGTYYVVAQGATECVVAN